MDTRFECLIDFTKGCTIIVDDHKWEPIAHGVVNYTYRDRAPVEIDIIEAAISAGKIKDSRKGWFAM